MKLKFLGTRANIERAPPAVTAGTVHCWYQHRRRRVIIGCGIDWLHRLEEVHPDAILITHAHPDHARGLKEGAPCLVYATAASWELLADHPIDDRQEIAARVPLEIAGIAVEAFPVEHSLRAPAVGYRVTSGRRTLFYVPDVVSIPDRSAALRGVDLYIGDGATMKRPMVRQREGAVFGHTTIRAQLAWCGKEPVPSAIFANCGTEVVAGDERRLGAALRATAREHDVAARFAYDGLELTLH